MIQDIHPHLFDNSFVSDSPIKGSDLVFHFKANALLVKQVGDLLELPQKSDFSESFSEPVFLFTLNNTRCFLVWECQKPSDDNFYYHEIKPRHPFKQKEIDFASGVALQMRNWLIKHRYCGSCGNKTTISTLERALICNNCNHTIYPSISPAIIVAIICKDKILLARGKNWPEGFYSLVAGYVDIGESTEDTVIREVKEEVGINISNIRYYASQPWPFSGSLMIGFIANSDETQPIKIDKEEIIEAAWFSRDNLPEYPQQRSIAGEIIRKFEQGLI